MGAGGSGRGEERVNGSLRGRRRQASRQAIGEAPFDSRQRQGPEAPIHVQRSS